MSIYLRSTSVLFAIALSFFLGTYPAYSQVNANRTLFGNLGVQAELKLSDEQKEKLESLLNDMEKEIRTALRAAKKGKTRSQLENEREEIEDGIVSSFAPKLSEVLTKEQNTRLRQISVQAQGIQLFGSRGFIKKLKITKEQFDEISKAHDEHIEKTQSIALDLENDVSKLDDLVTDAELQFFGKVKGLLNEEQVVVFDELIGEPFDARKLSSVEGKQGLALSFLFEANPKNKFFLLSDRQLQRKMKLAPDAIEKIDEILEETDVELSKVRLKTLRKLTKNFPDLSPDEQKKVVLEIVAKTEPILDSTSKQMNAILDESQQVMLNDRLKSTIHVRAIGDDSIAEEIKLSPKQKEAFQKLYRKFLEDTSKWRVYRDREDIDTKVHEQKISEFEAAAMEMLTADQRKTVEGWK